MSANPQLAAWLISKRDQIEALMISHLGPAAPSPAAVESEALRRFRSFAAAALRRGSAKEPALDGVRVHERRVSALLTAWSNAAEEVAGEQAPAVRSALAPLLAHFRGALRATQTSRRAAGEPRSQRRAVMAAIDRIADAFLALDVETGVIADANPAAGALLGIERDALLGVQAMAFVPTADHESWWSELDAISEGSEARRFDSSLQDRLGFRVPVDCTMTRFATRNRALALLLIRTRREPLR
ncbi:MAG TPA: PAS domain-containing protein [Myxococcota bacterium]|nr:PAS domain-containing protein [Myxococcota bacterium]